MTCLFFPFLLARSTYTFDVVILVLTNSMNFEIQKQRLIDPNDLRNANESFGVLLTHNSSKFTEKFVRLCELKKKNVLKLSLSYVLIYSTATFFG